MRVSELLLLLALPLTASADVAPAASALPTIFAPGVISDPNSASPAFAPDGNSVYFMRGAREGSMLMESHRTAGRWSAPQAAPFSGKWRDLDPAMAPDGSFLLFVSNRPAVAGDAALDAVRAGQRRAGQGMNIWRVDREGPGWSTPVRLPDAINACSMTFAPNVAADGSIYFIGCAPPSQDALVLLRAPYENGHYQAPQKVTLGDAGAQIRDPAIAPGRSFIIFSIKHKPQAPYRLAIAFHTPQGWTAPLDLGDTINGGTHNMGAQLGCDRRTLYYYSDRAAAGPPAGGGAAHEAPDNIWRVSLLPWLRAHAPEQRLPSAPACATD